MKRRMPLVGLTGGIGSGKTTVAGILGRLGAAVFDADKAARGLTTDPEIVRRIRMVFGDRVVKSSGELDRAGLAELVFSRTENTNKLNEIIHPGVFRQFWEFVAAREDDPGVEMIVIDAPLIYETELDTELDFVVVVVAEEELAIKRVKSRSQLTREQVLERMSQQIPLSEKARRADFCIDNNGGLADLEANSKDVFQRILERWKN